MFGLRVCNSSLQMLSCVDMNRLMQSVCKEPRGFEVVFSRGEHVRFWFCGVAFPTVPVFLSLVFVFVCYLLCTLPQHPYPMLSLNSLLTSVSVLLQDSASSVGSGEFTGIKELDDISQEIAQLQR